MILIIAGTRTFLDKDLLFKTMKELPEEFYPIEEVLCGECVGADLLGKQWAEENSIPVTSYPADWSKHGTSAGYIRNRVMAEAADGLIAFWDNESRGTAMMIRLMQQAEKPVLVIKYK